MIKRSFLIFILFAMCGCSFNPNSKYWTEDSSNLKEINQKNKNNDTSNEILDPEYEKIKEQIIEYGKNKDFPDINN